MDFPSEPLAALEDSGELAFFLTSTKRSEIEYEVAVRSQQSSGSVVPATGTYVQTCQQWIDIINLINLIAVLHGAVML